MSNVYKSPDEYLPIICPIDSGKYLSIKDFNSGTVLFFINVIILRKISIIAKAYTKDENLLKKTTTTINKIKMIAKSIYTTYHLH